MRRRSLLLVATMCLLGSLSWLDAGVPGAFQSFAQVGDGGGIRTIVLVMNKGGAQVSVTVTFRAEDGTALQLTIDGTTDSVFQFNLGPGEMKRLETSGTSDPIKVGWAQLEASGEVGAQLIFEISSGGELKTSAAVESGGAFTAADTFVEQMGGTKTGVAIANLSPVGSVTVKLTLFDESGVEVASSTFTIEEALGKQAKFLDQIAEFQSLGDFRGTLQVSASGSVSIMTLQQTGLVIGSLPPLEIF